MSREIIDSIQLIAGTKKENSCKYIFCTVSSVNAAGRLCTCTPEAGSIEAPFTNVLLMASVDDGILYLPKVGSTVVVGYSNRYQPYIAMLSSIDKILYTVGNSTLQITDGLILLNDGGAANAAIQLNDGSFGGLTKIAALTQKLNNLENLVNDLTGKFNAHTHPLVLSGGSGTATPTTLSEPSALTLTQQSDIENTSVTHGV